MSAPDAYDGPATAVQCPECSDVIVVPIKVEMWTEDDGTQRMSTEPDLADLWAHAWTHNAQGGAR